MTKKKIIELLYEHKDLYECEAEHSRKRLLRNNPTAQQIAKETIHMQDMESRAYAIRLLLEEIEMADK